MIKREIKARSWDTICSNVGKQCRLDQLNFNNTNIVNLRTNIIPRPSLLSRLLPLYGQTTFKTNRNNIPGMTRNRNLSMTIMMRLTYVLSLSDGLRSLRWLLSSQSEAWIIHSDQWEALVPDSSWVPVFGGFTRSWALLHLIDCWCLTTWI